MQVSKHLQENYIDYYADSETAVWRRIGSFEKAKNITSLCFRYPHESILEIGAGDGSILERLAEQRFGEKLYGLEISLSGIQSLKQKKIPSLVNCALFDGYRLPYLDRSFDLAILSHVLEHTEYPRKLIYEASRVAKYVFVEVPLEDTVRLSKDYTFDKVGHINFYSPKSIRRFIQTCGLVILEQKTTNRSIESHIYIDKITGSVKFFIKELILKFSPRIATFIFTYHEALVCQRK